MNTRALVLAALAASLLLVGAAGAATAQSNQATDHPADNASENATDAGAPDDRANGPPAFVSEIHALVDQFRAGDLGSLGEAVADVTPGDGFGADDGDADDADESPAADRADDTPASDRADERAGEGGDNADRNDDADRDGDNADRNDDNSGADNRPDDAGEQADS